MVKELDMTTDNALADGKVVDLSIATGHLFELKINNLKKMPLVVFGENLNNEISVDFDNRVVSIKLTGEADYPEDETDKRVDFMVECLKRIIGQYEILVFLNKKALNARKSDSSNAKVRKPTNTGGKKGLRKVPKRK